MEGWWSPSGRCLEHWDGTTDATFDHKLWDELCSLRFVEAANNLIIMGPVGVGKTFLTTALGHIAVRRRHSVYFERADRLHKRLRAARLDNSHDAELRKLLRVDLLILDDFALGGLNRPTPTTSTRSSSNATATRRRSSRPTANPSEHRLEQGVQGGA